MWLAYLRFDSDADTRIAFVECANATERDAVLAAAKAFRDWPLTEYAVFQGRASTRASSPTSPKS